MDDTHEFESRMRSMNERLVTVLRKSKVEHELTLLDRQIRDLEMQNAATDMQMGQYNMRQVGGESKFRPGPRRQGADARVDHTARYGDPHMTSHETEPKRFGSDMPPWCSPIAGQSNDDETNLDPYRFVTQRRKPAPNPVSSTPKSDDQTQTEAQPVVKPSHGAKMKPATFDGSGSWRDYKAHFEVCAALNGWSEIEKGMYLAVSLRGQAQGVYGNLGSGASSTDYGELVRALEERFAPPNQQELYRVQLRERRQKASESLSELGQDIKRLTNLAYPTAPTDVRETLAKEQFVDALFSSDMRLRIKQARPSNLNDAIRHAVELEAYNRAEKRQQEAQGYIQSATEPNDETKSLREDMTSLQKSMSDLTKAFETLSQQTNAEKPSHGTYPKQQFGRRFDSRSDKKKYEGKPKRRCFSCGSEDHFQASCPKSQSNRRKPSTNVLAVTSSGLYAEFKVNGLVTEFLIDTGASVSVLSIKVWNIIKDSCTSELKPYHANLQTASGETIDIKGKIAVSLEICGVQLITDVIVANIDSDAIFGLDIMQSHGCQLNLMNNTLEIKGQTCQLKTVGRMGCYRVSVSEKVEIPSRSEVVIEGKVAATGPLQHKTGILEPAKQHVSSDRPMVARVLVQGDEKVPVRLMNLSDEKQILYPGTHVANFSTVSSVKPLESKQGSSNNSSQVPAHLNDLYTRTVDGMTKSQAKQVASLLSKYSSTFSENDSDLGRTGIITHKIPTGDARPIKQPLRRVPVHMREEVDTHIDEMLDKGVIRPSTSPWSSGIVLVTKKDGTKRFCVDYRRVNDVTIKDAYPLPRTDDALGQLSGSKWFSCLDLNSGYWQIEVDENDKCKTAFSTRQGLFEFNLMPFGLCNAPATFERLMETVLAGLNWQICLVYLDDIIVTGKTFEDMVKNLDSVLSRLTAAGLRLKPRKCQLFGKRVEFLGHIVSEDGIHTDPKKTEAVREWPVPNNVRDLRSFLGFCGYYRKFLKNHSEIAKPLHRLTEKTQKFIWSEECSQAFNTLKKMLVEAPVLAHPDFTKPFLLDTDASDMAIGSVLSQVIDGKEKVIGYASRTLTKAEKKYCVTRKELLAVVVFIKHFRHYLYGKKFIVRTDHGSLRWLMNFKNPEGQVARWHEVLSSYEFDILHRPGRQHRNADGMSRIPCKQCGRVDEDEVEFDQQHVIKALYELDQGDPDSVDIKSAQESDRDISRLKEYLQKEVRPERSEIAEESYFFKSLWSQWQRLDIQNGLLVRRWDVLGTDITNWQAIVPLAQRRFVLKQSHDIRASGHLGMKKTVSKIRQKYYWPGLQSDVRMYIAGCEKCTKRKYPMKTKKAPMQIVRAGYPMERIAVDILGELPMTEKGNKYILVISDYFTKWTESFPMANMEARTVANIMVEHVIARFGIPEKIHSDQGRQFVSKLSTEMCSLLQIEKTRTTPYHPQSDGMVERFNRTLCAMLSSYVSENQRDWDCHLQYVMMAYRATEHETTGCSPNMLMLGRETTTPLDIAFEMHPSIKPIPESQYVWELRERLESVHTMVRQYTGQSIQRQKKYQDMKLSYDSFQVGDEVYVYFPVKKSGQTSKFTSFWRGPYKIVAKLSDVLYKVDCGRSNSVAVIHCDRLMKARSQTLFGENEIVSAGGYSSDTEPRQGHGSAVDDSRPDNEPPPEEGECAEETDVIDVPEGSRVRKKPAWMKDYVLSTCRSQMAKTKNVPRKHPICPSCKETIPSSENFDTHLVKCAKTRKPCDRCPATFKRETYLTRHMKLKHGVSNSGSNVSGPRDQPSTSREGTGEQDQSKKRSAESLDSSDLESTDDSSWDQDPKVDILEEKSNNDDRKDPLILGRLVRKPTNPAPVNSGVKRKTPDQNEADATCKKQKEMCAKRACIRRGEKETQANPEMVDIATQVEVLEIPGDQNRCEACGITFDDAAMMYIHKGCHTTGNEKRCNVCGQDCQDKMSFFIHVTMGHRQ